jgi:hypothetical protein
LLLNQLGAAAGGPAPPRVLKLGDFHMKRLKNGDVYKVGTRCAGSPLMLVARAWWW